MKWHACMKDLEARRSELSVRSWTSPTCVIERPAAVIDRNAGMLHRVEHQGQMEAETRTKVEISVAS